jgi:hypothetical protein
VDVSVEALLYPVHILGYTGVHTREPRDCTPTNKENEDDYRTGICYTWAEAEFLDEIQTKVLRVFFLLAIHSPLCSFAVRFIFI